MSAVILGITLIGALGVFLIGVGVARVRRRRLLAASRSALGGGLCLALGGFALAVMSNLYTYHRLTYEQPVAKLRFTRLGPQHFCARLTMADDRQRQVEIRGDEWQLDARVLKWRGIATLLGFDALYRLDRLSGRYASVADENSRPRRAYSLRAGGAGIDAFSLARHLPRWAAFVDAQYGSATYLPMADGAAFAVTLTQSGLIARPANAAAERVTRDW